MTDPMTRRDFMKASAVLLGGATVLGGAAGCSGPSAEADAEIETPSARYGGDSAMGKRILVGYATRTGSTVGVAEAIGRTLADRGFAVDVKPVKERPSLDGYDGVVVGSAINGAAWLPEALTFVEGNRRVLGKIPVATFCVHAMNLGDDEKSRRKRFAYIDKVRALITPVDEGYFAGKGPTAEDTSLIARWAFKAFGGGAEGDSRDWDEIRAWALQARM